MKVCSPVWLGSASPRRRLLLRDAGIDVHVQPADLDDGDLMRGQVSPRQWVLALAYFKARRVADMLRQRRSPGELHSGTVLAADTLCVHGDEVLGQPAYADEARRMLLAMRDATHETMTGVCLLPLSAATRVMFVDVSIVHVGHVTDPQIDDYVASNQWRGKAGAYNLSERIEAGWPVRCVGDPATVMGLPMQRLRHFLGIVGR